MTTRTRLVVRLIVAFGIVSICVGAVAWFLFGGEMRERLSRQRFEQSSWQAGHSRTNAVRIRMVDDLLHSHRFGGMTRNQTTAILGEPDKTEYFREWDMVYWLGPERGFMSLDSEWLVFRVDSQDKVTDYRIVKD